jgi:hypothetical protein
MMSLEWSFSPNTQFVIGQHFTDHAFLPRTNHSRRAQSERYHLMGDWRTTLVQLGYVPIGHRIASIHRSH